MYGAESLDLSNKDIKKMETCQGNIIKKSLGLSKFSHSTEILCALNINKIHHTSVQNSISLWNRLFSVNSPTTSLCSDLYGNYLQDGSIIPGTLLSKIIHSKLSPLSCAMSKCKYNHQYRTNNGVVDSLKLLLLSENFNKPYSDDHQMAIMLTRSF